MSDQIKGKCYEVTIIGFALSLSMGFLDLCISIVSEKPSGLSSFLLVLPPLVVSVGFFFLLYIALWFLTVGLLGRLLRLETVPLALSIALFLVVSYILVLVNVLPRIFHPGDLIRLSVPLLTLVLASLLISIGGYFAIKVVISRLKYRNTVVLLSLALPFVLAETMISAWSHTYLAESFFSLQSLLINIGYLFTVLFTLILFYYIGQPFATMRLLTAFMMLVILSPLATFLFPTTNSKAHTGAFKKLNHRIRHVILITVDTLRADALSCYGTQQSVHTPGIDRLAEDGVLFTNAISPSSWTLPSVASIMTGLPPSVHKTVKTSSKLTDNLTTLAEYMLDAGYFTAAIGYNPLLLPQFNISQGFHEYNFFPRTMGHTFGPMLLELFSKRFFYPFLPDGSTRDLTKLAVNWLERNYEKDFFLWIHYYDPHSPYAPPAAYLPKGKLLSANNASFGEPQETLNGLFVPSVAEREWIKGLYNAEVRYVDDNIGELIGTLKKLNLYDESLIIFTSDHGEEFWEHGGIGHGHTLYNEVLRVPLIVKLPMSASTGQIDTLVSTQNIMPTALDLTGVEYDDNYPYVSSLSSLWGSNPDEFYNQAVISTGQLYGEDRESVIFDGMKYIRSLITNREELYDLTHDPQERISIIGSFSDKVATAKSILREHKEMAKVLRKNHHLVDGEGVKLDKGTEQKLRTLGYIQ